MSLVVALFVLTGISLACFSCGNGSNQPASQNQERRYVMKGKVITIDKPRQQIVVDHEAIVGFMGAMEMPYLVKDAKSLDQLAAGDEIRADVVVNDGRAVLENIVVTKKASGAPAPSGSAGLQPKAKLQNVVADGNAS